METRHKSGCTFEENQAKIIMPVFDSLDALRGRWRLPILISLLFGAKRFSQISRVVTGISDKVLARELKELELNQLIVRTVQKSFPPTVEYSVTPHGESVERLVIELRNWGEKHRKQVIGK